MSLQRLLSFALIIMLTAMVGCGTGTKQSPVASDSLEAGEELGELSEDYGLEDGEEADQSEEDGEEFSEEESTEKEDDSDFDAVEEKTYADTYTVKAGDSLSSIAGKEEIYGDSSLWPVLQEYNRDTLGNSQSVNAGARLKIPRRLTTEEMDEAREKARQIAAVEDVSQPEKVSSEAGAEEAAPEESAAAPEAEELAAPEIEAPIVKNKPRPVPKPKDKGMMPILVVIFVVLLLAAAVLLYFMKKDNDDEEA